MMDPSLTERGTLSQVRVAELGSEARHGRPVPLACRSGFRRPGRVVSVGSLHGVPGLGPHEPRWAPKHAELSAWGCPQGWSG